MDVHERGKWQLRHVGRLAFHFNISFYLLEHSPLWRSKFRIRMKKTRTKIGTSRISHTSSMLHPASRELHKDQLESLVGTCLTLPNLGFLWVFFKYPKISKNGNPLFFPVAVYQWTISAVCSFIKVLIYCIWISLLFLKDIWRLIFLKKPMFFNFYF